MCTACKDAHPSNYRKSMKTWYVCPFCNAEIEDTIDALNAHRFEGGVCDQRMSFIKEQNGSANS